MNEAVHLKETSRTSHVSWSAFLLDTTGLNPFLWHKNSRFSNVAVPTNSQGGEG